MVLRLKIIPMRLPFAEVFFFKTGKSIFPNHVSGCCNNSVNSTQPFAQRSARLYIEVFTVKFPLPFLNKMQEED